MRRALPGLKVLVAEDDLAIAEVLKIALENHGVVVTIFDGISFADFAEFLNKEPDLFVCDMKLPGGPAAVLCKEVLKKYPKCEVMLMTGAIDSPDTITLGYGFKYPILLRKPFSLTKFTEMVVALAG